MEEDNPSFTPDMLRFSVAHNPAGSKILDLLGKQSIKLTEAECAELAEELTASVQDLSERSQSYSSGNVAYLVVDSKRRKSFEALAR